MWLVWFGAVVSEALVQLATTASRIPLPLLSLNVDGIRAKGLSGRQSTTSFARLCPAGKENVARSVARRSDDIYLESTNCDRVSSPNAVGATAHIVVLAAIDLDPWKGCSERCVA